MENTTPDLLCFSHLRWNFVFQRPQHIMTRFSEGMRVFYFEEPEFGSKENGKKITEVQKNLFVITPLIKQHLNGTSESKILEQLVQEVLMDYNIKNYWCWYYTPMAVNFTHTLNPELIIYDCMDELSAFRFAPLCLHMLEQTLLSVADIVFTGGHHLFELKRKVRDWNIFPFPSSIDKEHFGKARKVTVEPPDQKDIPKPRIGFFGVLDERLNIQLLDEIAAAKPEWNFILLGPVVKITMADLPKSPNIHYPGMKNYNELPDYIAGWDVAILPFALNESTKYTSPTKTPEYLAAGKPVVSTSIRDVVKTYGEKGHVHIADDAQNFIDAIEWELGNVDSLKERIAKSDKFLSTMSWNKTWIEMISLIIKIREKKTFSSRGREEQEYV
jgi:glycosyltransferase involved in cell wall biosynthesis